MEVNCIQFVCLVGCFAFRFALLNGKMSINKRNYFQNNIKKKDNQKNQNEFNNYYCSKFKI